MLSPKIEGVPGGIRTDEKGNLYVAGEGIRDLQSRWQAAPRIEMHESAGNCAFGDADFKTLFITAADVVSTGRGWT